MIYLNTYKSPIGEIYLNSDGENLIRVCFKNSRDYNLKFIEDAEEKNLPIFDETIKWFDVYFQGEEPKFTPKYKIDNLTPFRKAVIDEMIKIPFGKTITYNDIAKAIAKKRGIKRMSAQAVGGAVGWNPIGIIIPCHRVVGTNGSLTGYGGGIQNKVKLFEVEGIDLSKYTIPTKGTAL